MVFLINPFQVFEGREEEFLELWDLTNEIFRVSPGYGSARLVKAMAHRVGGQCAPFTHVNLAEWRSAKDYQQALANPALLGFLVRYRQVCSFDPALYEVVRVTCTDQTDRADRGDVDRSQRNGSKVDRPFSNRDLIRKA